MFKVLLVDDERFVTRGLRVLIDWEGCGFYVCGEAENGIQALELIRQESPQLVITDIKMPGMDGLELIKEVRTQLKTDTEFVLLTGYGEFDYARTALKFGVTDYILKPVDTDELTAVLRKTCDKLKEKAAYEREYKEGRSAIVNNLFKRLLKGEAGQAVIEELRSYAHIDDTEGLQLLVIELDDLADWLDDLTGSEIDDKLENFRNSIMNSVDIDIRRKLFQMDMARYGLLIDKTAREKISNLGDYCEELRKGINLFLKCSVSFYTSMITEDLSQLSQCYKTVKDAMKYKFFKGRNSMIFYEDIKDIDFNYKFDASCGGEGLIEAIEKFDEKLVCQKIENLFADFSERTLAPEIIRALINNLTIDILKVVNEIEGNVDQIIKESTLFACENYNPDINEMKKRFTGFCICCTQYIKSLRENGMSGLISEVLEYVKNNFRQNLKLKNVSEKFFINPIYLGRLFKKQYGMYFNDYLHVIRIEEAKKLLRRTEMKIYEISDYLGYSDSDYFISIFEKLVNTTPTKFRKEYRE